MASILGMYLFAKIQERRRREKVKKETLQLDQRLTLPVEILEQIVAFVRDRRILVILCTVSRTFMYISAPILYRSLELKLDCQLVSRTVKLHKTMSNQQFSAYVVEFNVTLLKSTPEPSRTKRGFYPDPPASQRYRRMEKIAGEIAVGLSNLKVLRISCELGSDHVTTLDFLSRLSTRGLRVLYVRCHCVEAAIDTNNILSAPCMQSVTSLGWRCQPVPTECSSDDVWDTGILPNLTGLCVDGRSNLTEIAYARPMTKMDFRFFDDQVARQVRNHAANITHLNIADGINRPIWKFLKEIAPQLTSLRFLGQLPLRESFSDALLQALKCLGSTLVVLHIQEDSSVPYWWVQSTLPYLYQSFPKLRLVIEKRGAFGRHLDGDASYWTTIDVRFLEWRILEDGFERALRLLQYTTDSS